MLTPAPENVDGDFYVGEGCCTCCDVPMIEAPGLFTYSQRDEYVHCYVSKQPDTGKELDDMLRTISCAETRCIHYRGNDAVILRRLVSRGDSDVCDSLYPDPTSTEAGIPVRRWWQFWKH
ncbi:MAG TPA: ferredoxin [Planctomycetes bacterium]|nr:ferredoxin [Fuerstiella sp.]HIK93344.1 ferredoxin [Planctomycetota bacterium]